MGRKLIGDKWSLLPAKYAMDEELPHRLVRHPTGLRDVMRKLNYYYFFSKQSGQWWLFILNKWKLCGEIFMSGK